MEVVSTGTENLDPWQSLSLIKISYQRNSERKRRYYVYVLPQDASSCSNQSELHTRDLVVEGGKGSGEALALPAVYLNATRLSFKVYIVIDCNTANGGSL